MTREDVLTIARKAGDVGTVKHEEFADYIISLESQRRVGEEWQPVENAYMAVDGKLAMANEDHRRQGKRLDFGEPKVLLDNDEQLTLLVTVTSEIYGTRHGIATSRKQNGTRAEREFPWEVAETSAIGRALTAMGYGLLPGAGLASVEDMLRAGAAKPDGGNGADKEPRETTRTAMRTAPMSANQRSKLVELYCERYGGTEAEALQGLDAIFQSTFRHNFAEASLAEASRIISQMIAQKSGAAAKK